MIYLLSTASVGSGQEDNLEKRVRVGVVTPKLHGNELHMSSIRGYAHKSANLVHSFHMYYKKISEIESFWSYKD